jgi:predicted nucleic acid-binding protein
MILPDTDVMVDILRQVPPAVAWLDSLGNEEIVLPGFVVTELLLGCRDRAEQRAMIRGLGAYRRVWPGEADCNQAVVTFADAHLRHGTGIIDALIGQVAVRLDLPLHTFNQRHYAGIPSLRAIQPYIRS